MLVGAIVIACDRAGADVDVLADSRVADVAQVIDLTAVADFALLDLDEVANLDLVRELDAGPDPGKGTDLAIGPGCRCIDDRVRMHDSARTEHRIADYTVRFDSTAISEPHVAFENRVDVDVNILTDA